MRRRYLRQEVYAGGRLVSPSHDNPAQAVFAGGKQIIPATITFSTTGAKTVTFHGTNGAKIYIDPGDGSAIDTVTLLGTSTDVDWNHTYSAAPRTARIYSATLNVSYINGVDEYITYIDNFFVFENITTLRLYTNSIIDISAIAGLTSLTVLYLYSNSIIDISAVAGLTSLTMLWLNNNNSIIDISAVAGLTSLTNLRLSTNSIIDISAVAGLTSLTVLWLHNNSVQTLPSAFPSWNGIDYQNQNNPNLPTDEWLIKLAAASVSNSTLRADGTCPARTSASDAAVATLIAAGCTVTVNEP